MAGMLGLSLTHTLMLLVVLNCAPNSPAPYEGQLPPVFCQEGNIESLVSPI